MGPQNGTSETAGRPLKAAQANGGGDGDQVLTIIVDFLLNDANFLFAGGKHQT